MFIETSTHVELRIKSRNVPFLASWITSIDCMCVCVCVCECVCVCVCFDVGWVSGWVLKKREEMSIGERRAVLAVTKSGVRCTVSVPWLRLSRSAREWWSERE
jgi:hypothetical protein